MAGIFGVVGEKNCVDDLFLGTFYLQHRAQDYCGLGLFNGKLENHTHRGLLKQQFPKERLRELKGTYGIGSVSSAREPVSELGGLGGVIISFDGNIINHVEIKDRLIREGVSFSGYHNPEEVSDAVLLSKIIARQAGFAKGIEKVVEMMSGDFAIVALTQEGVYAARGWGRKPLILGKKDGSYSVSSESNSFINTGMKVVRDVEPGEIVLLRKEGIQTISKLNLAPIKYDTFEWVYTAHPASTIDGKNVASVRKRIGAALARRYPVEADIVSPVPNSGRWHAIGYARESGIPYEEVFVRYDYSDRSFTPREQQDRDEEARTKLIPIREVVEGKRIILLDDSIVRGTQTLNQVKRLIEFGAKEVHARIACPPLMHACNYGKTTKRDQDCIARRMPIEKIQETLQLKSLGYARVEDLEEAMGLPREKLCFDCWET